MVRIPQTQTEELRCGLWLSCAERHAFELCSLNHTTALSSVHSYEIADYLEGEALQHDQPLMLHATGERTAECLFDEMEATGGEKVWATRRPRIEHGDGVIGVIPRAAKLGVIVALNPTHFVGDLALRQFGPEYAKMWQPFKSLVDAGLPIVIAGDAGPGESESNPFLNIHLEPLTPPTRKRPSTAKRQ